MIAKIPGPSSSSSPPPKKNPNCTIIDASEAKKPASVMTITSRLAMWVSSWAMTPSSSAGESSSMMPVVAQTVAAFFERPRANALGIVEFTTSMRGLGRSAWMHRRSIIACSSGASCGETSWAPIERSASLSEVKNCSEQQAAGDDQDRDPAGAGGEEHADEHDVDGAEQEHRDQHPDLQPGVAAEGGGASHASDLATAARARHLRFVGVRGRMVGSPPPNPLHRAGERGTQETHGANPGREPPGSACVREPVS